MVKVNEKKDPTEIISEAFSVAGRAQNTDFVADVTRSGDAKGAEVQNVSLRRAKGKQEEVVSIVVAEIDSMIAILEHVRDVLIPRTNGYGIPADEPEETGRKKK